jgi:hypothetical protein
MSIRKTKIRGGDEDRRFKHHPSVVADCRLRFAAGASMASIALTLGLPYPTVRAYCKCRLRKEVTK